MAKNLKKIGVGIVSLTGGEPFLREDLPIIIKIFADLGFAVQLQTGGFNITKEKIKQIVKAGCRDVIISLHSLDPQKQDYISGCKGSWANIIQTIAYLTEELPKINSFRSITTVVSPHNIKELPKLVRFATRIGFCISLPVVQFPNSFKGTIEPKYFATGEEISKWKCQIDVFGLVDTIYKELLKMKRKGFYICVSSRFLKESINFIKYGHAKWKTVYSICSTPGSLFFIAPDGHFELCSFIEFADDISLLDPDFPTVFYSKEFRKRTKEKTNECKGCICVMADLFLLHKDLSVFFERFVTDMKMRNSGAKILSYDEILKIINSL